MNAPFQFTPQAIEDLDVIWWGIADDNREAADLVELEVVATCRRLAKHPLMGSAALHTMRLAGHPSRNPYRRGLISWMTWRVS
jgi:plasmid stabilization system protein ParE